LVPSLLGVLVDKTQSIRSAAQSGASAIVKQSTPEGVRQILDMLKDVLTDSKQWRAKVGALKAMEATVKPGSEEWVAEQLGHIIPVVEGAMHDTKSEVRGGAVRISAKTCTN
jgi:elongation factor 3